MKSAVLPQVRIEPELRTELESVLAEGETLSSFVESSVRRAIEHRQALRDFDARCDASLKHFLATGQSHGSDELLAELRQRTEARRAQLQAAAGSA
ncbi:YlcI/YnfO family protein [Methylibium petroleiphilum]|uniref:Prevent-host-death protein n=1 Tax=Methylibium petroleiphilum (strain ATCC BAA-1232 / LMG 22953 / PM1) TaxID=420662 RepID=A2SMX1_METPP|nr:YlcI/YnfO family protein [Methylibium petroleiphilum]ABM96910.1 conserved hypothetical protein [Methylibium petroleiphilum PM1]